MPSSISRGAHLSTRPTAGYKRQEGYATRDRDQPEGQSGIVELARLTGAEDQVSFISVRSPRAVPLFRLN